MYILTESQKLNYTPYKGVTELKKLGGVEKGNRIVSGRQRMEAIEAEIMNIAYKAGRSENQRNERRNKR